MESEFSFFVWVTGGSSSARFTCSADQPWISVNPINGTASTSNSETEILVSIDRTKFDSGTYSGIVTVSSPGLESKTFAVRASVGLSTIGVSETSHDFGAEETSWSFDVWNAGSRGTSLAYTLSADVPWVSLSPTSGASTGSDDRQTIQVTLDRSLLGKAVYSGTITVTSEKGDTRTIAISARDPLAAIGLSSTSHNFGTAETEWSLRVYNAGEAGSVLDFAVSTDSDWLLVTPTSGVSTGIDDEQEIQVVIDRGGLEVGQTYQGQITVTAPDVTPQTVSVVVQVAAPSLAVSTRLLDFGGTDTQRTFGVSNPGQAGSVAVYSITAPGDPWISIEPASGSVIASEDPDIITVTIDRSTMSKAAQTKAFTPYRTVVGTGADAITVVVVGGTATEMGRSLGELMADEIVANMTSYETFAEAAGIDTAALDDAWQRVSPFIDQQFLDELQGVADGLANRGYSGRYQRLVRIHMIPVIESYSCSAIAVWGKASADEHLYQIRNLDWELESGAQDNPWIVVYHPTDGIPHANVGFAGMLGCITGINSKGIALSEVGDSPSSEAPYNLNGEHFATLLRKILYDADNLTEAVDILAGTERIKRYHYVFGDGRNERRAVKIKAHAPDTPPNDLIIYTDADPNDPVRGEGLSTFDDVVYHAESRDPIAHEHLTNNYGTYDSTKMITLSRNVATHGASVLNAVYDATSLEMWVAFAEGADSEAYTREYVYVDLHKYFELPTEAEGTIQVTTETGDRATVLVRARQSEPAIGVSANSHDFGLNETSWNFDVWNAGDGGTTLNFTAIADQPWISVTPSTGSSTGPANEANLKVTINRSMFEKTVIHEGSVTIKAASGQTQAVRIIAGYPEPLISVSPPQLDFGNDLEELTFFVWNGGDSSSSLTFTATASEEWISSVTPSSGTSTGPANKVEITVTVDRSLLAGIPGLAEGSIELTGTNAQGFSLPVKLTMAPPSPSFTAEPTSVGRDREVVFTDTTTAGSGEVVEWEWDFGDGSEPVIVTNPTSLPVQVTHAYETYNFYTVTLTVRCEYDLEGTITRTNYIRVEPQPATAQFTVSDSTPDMFQVVNFTDKSDPGSGVITSWRWDLGDGTTSSAKNVTHTYMAHGTYTVTLTITTTYQSSGIPPATRTITVGQVLPTADFEVDKKIVYTEIDPLTFTDLSTIPGPWSERMATWSAWRGGIADMPSPQANWGGEYWTGTYEANKGEGLYYFFFDRSRYTCRLIERSKYQADPVGPDDPGASWYTSSETKDSLIEVRVPSPLDIYCRHDDGTQTLDPDWPLGICKDFDSSSGKWNGKDYTCYVLKFISQKWVLNEGASEPPVADAADNIWEHWLTIIVPGPDPFNFNPEFRTAVLYVEGGDQDEPKPEVVDPYLLQYALETGHVVASVHQVPNQPIGFTDAGDLSGHEIIAYSFSRFMATGDTFWPAVFPMAKSVVKAMTAVQNFLAGKVPQSPYSPTQIAPIVIDDFVLAGADIQAWAVWLAGAHDERVRALMPMCFDFMSIYPQIRYQAGPFDDPETPTFEFSEAWGPYTAPQFNVFDRMEPVSTLDGAFGMKRYRKRFEMHMRDVITGGVPCAPNLVVALSGFMLNRVNTPCYDPNYDLSSYLGRVDAVFPPDPALGYPSYSQAVFAAANVGLACPSQAMDPSSVTGGPRSLFRGSLYRMDLVVQAMLEYETMQYNNNLEGWLTAMVDPAFYGERYGDTTYWYSERGGRLGMPKCIISSPGSAYYVPTSAQIWLADMNGQNYFRYIPNTDHYLNQTGDDNQKNYKDAFLTALPWFEEFLAENGNPVVPFRWGLRWNEYPDGSKSYLINMDWLDTDNIPEDLVVNLWAALDWENDFRQDETYRPVDPPTWSSTLVGELPPASNSGYYPIEVTQNEYWYKAFFLEVSYSNALGLPVKYTSPGYVFPPKFPGQRPPALAEFVAKPLAAAVGATIQFTDLSNPGLDPITSWYWEFGDGTTSTVQNPTHAYTSAGQYTVKLRVTNIVGGTTKIRTNYITVN